MNEIIQYAIYYGMYIVYFVLLFLVLKFIFSKTQKHYNSRWQSYIDGFNYSTQNFYKLIEEELNNLGIKSIKTKHVNLKEGGAFSASRTYLKITWKDFEYYISGAPFAKLFYFSSWCFYRYSILYLLISKIPFIGSYLARVWYPITFYKIDTKNIFASKMHEIVLKVIDNITEEKGVRLSESDRKPILNDIFKR
ncbi:MAG: hypothetical protein GY760_26970 [Deltaproteobacteria bacterium]|nr:hypothetical protein [Deltaproteobacteria bacterium]